MVVMDPQTAEKPESRISDLCMHESHIQALFCQSCNCRTLEEVDKPQTSWTP